MADDLTVFAIETEALSGILDTLDYFQVLKIPQTATVPEIKAAYYRESRAYHPDRVFHLPDAELKDRVNRVYKRITEAYFVLRDDAKRSKYTADINGPYRALKLRFDELSETEQKKQKEEELGTTPNGKKFFSAALVDLAAGKLEAAERNLKMALMYEPQNARFKEKADEVAKRLKEKSKSAPKA